MTITQMLGQSALLTLLGMCVVFGFIVIMILCMKLLHAVIHVLKLDKEDAPAQKPAAKASGTSSAPVASTDNNAVVAAIAAAIHDKTLNS
jgi:oxaloacetate decarboxylase (Na+ extruding) subunit gamma